MDFPLNQPSSYGVPPWLWKPWSSASAKKVAPTFGEKRRRTSAWLVGLDLHSSWYLSGLLPTYNPCVARIYIYIYIYIYDYNWLYVYIYVIVKWGLTHIWKFIHGAPLFLFVALFAYSYIYIHYTIHMNIVWFKPLPSIQVHIGYGHTIILYIYSIYTYRYTYLIPRYPVFVGEFLIFFLLKPKKPPWRPHGTCQAHADLLESSVVALREARDRFCYVCHISYICFILYTVYDVIYVLCVMMLILIDYVYVHSWLICSIMNMLICLITLV